MELLSFYLKITENQNLLQICKMLYIQVAKVIL